MDGYLNPIDGTGYTDRQNVDIASLNMPKI